MAAADAAPDRAGADPDTLCGELVRFVWQAPDGARAVAVLDDPRWGRWKVVGPLWGVQQGHSVRLWGKVAEHPVHGRQFAVESAQPALPQSAQGLAAWLASGVIRGVGKRTAQRIVERLGDTAVDQIKANVDVLHGIVGKKRRKVLADKLRELDAAEQTALFLFGLGIGPTLVRRIQARHAGDSGRVVRERPFSLIDDVVGIGFRTADKIARAQGLAFDAPERLRAAVRFALGELAAQGHTAPPRDRTLQAAAVAAEVPADALQALVAEMAAEGRIAEVQTCDPTGALVPALALPDLAHAEQVIFDHVCQACAQVPAAARDDDPRLRRAAETLGFELAGQQRQAVLLALTARLLVVTGGPGTGKTTILRGVLAALDDGDAKVVLAAPTGRAARRLAEAAGLQAKTLHRLLAIDPGRPDAGRGKVAIEADLVIVDEASMVDAALMAQLLGALPEHARLVLVGDADQLPSVGPGAVLADLLACAEVPRVRLDQVFRQAEASRIVRAAHAILAGQVPDSAPAGGDFFVVARDEPAAIADTVLKVVLERLPRLGFDPKTDVQVLAPMHKGALGVAELNLRLRELLNPDGETAIGAMRVGDKVLQLRNDYRLDLSNGDIGVVVGTTAVEVDDDDAAGDADDEQDDDSAPAAPATLPALVVRFGDRLVDYPAPLLENLTLAYAITVHKSQGSEYPAVVLPVHSSQWAMLQRNLIYTAITRARRFCVLVGQDRAIRRAAANDAPVWRNTRLRALWGQ
ncbi:MAG: ATP-dependent RecD-like DNA helicase [Deltaproteobacteria bacterium]|nr:ATP-dependent RecD-like DNA helicase [Deltaproteobacteria bacterium]